MPSALIVSRYFPPLSSAGASIRLVKLIKYAAKEDWSFAVLTQDPDRTVIPEKRLSEFLLNELPADTQLIRIGNPLWGRTILTRLGRKIAKDSSLPWGVSVAWQGWRKLRRSKPDLVFVNTPPFTNVAIGMILATLFAVPLILDIKDDWVGSPTYWKKGRLRRRIESWIEERVIRKACAVITVTSSSHQACLQRYSPLGLAKKFFFIPNGEDVEEYQALRGRTRKAESERFRLLSAAAGYRPDYRDLTPFLQALELFIKRCPEAQNLIDIEFLGEDPDDRYKTWLERLLPPSAIYYSGVLDRQTLVEHLWQADLFFLIQPRENFTAIAGTLYEYWAVGKAPVLLFSETGASSSLVIDNWLGKHFDFKQEEEASQYIAQLYQAFYDGHPIWIERTGVEAYDRRKMVKQMLQVWSDALKNSRRH